MEFSKEQLELLNAHQKPIQVKSIISNLTWFIVNWALVGGLIYLTVNPPVAPIVFNVLVFFAILRLLALGLFAPFSVVGVVVTLWHSVKSEEEKTAAIHKFFVDIQQAGLNLPRFDWNVPLMDVSHLALVVALGCAGWFVLAFLYLPAWLVCRVCYSGIRHYTVEYFKSLTAEEIALLENEADSKTNPLQGVIAKAYMG